MLSKSKLKKLLLIFFLCSFYAINCFADDKNTQIKRENRYFKDAQEIANSTKENLRNYNYQQHFPAISGQGSNFDKNLDSYQRNLKGLLPNVDLTQVNQESQRNSKKQLNQLMVFVSSSLDKNTLSQYANQVRKSGGVMVFRGIIDNSMQKTISFIHSLSKDGTRAIIDPFSYRNFKIKHVPQIVVVADNHDCKWGRCNNTPLHDKISGNISLEYALNQISQKGEFAQKEAKRFLANLRKN